MSSELITIPRGHTEPSPKRVRVLFGGTYVVDTRKAKLVWEKPFYPTYFFPYDTLDTKYLQESSSSSYSSKIYDIVVGDRRAEGVVTKYFQTDGEDGKLAGLLKITFGAMDAWFEEDEQVFVHPKDPYKRVDVLQSSRHIRVEVNGVEVANTRSPVLLFETGLPVRTYIKKTDCTVDLFLPSELTTQCPYKVCPAVPCVRVLRNESQGTANYYHVRAGQELAKDIVWWYQSPILEVAAVKGYVAFYDEKVDVWVDGKKQERPVSHFV